MTIKILGTGCAKCKATQEVIEKVSKELGLSPTILKVEDMQEIMQYNVFSTPVVVIDEQVKIKGRVPTMNEVRELMQGA
jgi:small redox-active disulfide protein 2